MPGERKTSQRAGSEVAGPSDSPQRGDKPVDGVDNSIGDGDCSAVHTGMEQREPPRSEQAGDQPVRSSDQSGGQQRGADLARSALEAARAAAAGRRSSPGRRVPGRGRGSARRRRGWSGSRSDDRDPQPLGRLASRLVADRGWTDRVSGGQVFGRWEQLVGEEVAEHARPVALREGELTVQASSTAWATQLRLLQRQLLGRITAGVGRGVVTRLRILGPAAPSWQFGSRHVRGRGPRDTYG